jgi:hypothetical protein
MLSRTLLSLTLVLAISLASRMATFQDHPTGHAVAPLNKIPSEQWIERAWGDSSKAGEPFVFRIHNDPGYIVLPHVHPIDEYNTVVKGSWSLGMGQRFNESALQPVETGAFALAPKDTAHFAWSKTETVVQVHGIGPFASVVVDPVYELTDKGAFLLTSLLLPGRPTSTTPPDCFALTASTHPSRHQA